MAQIRTDSNNPMTFARLMRLGQVAHAQGDKKDAYEYWSQAAMLEPDDEHVWTALMWVIENDEDRKVCLKNILAINPQNIRAQEMLDDLIGETQPQKENPPSNDDSEADMEATDSINLLHVVILSLILGFGGAISIILLQMLFA